MAELLSYMNHFQDVNLLEEVSYTNVPFTGMPYLLMKEAYFITINSNLDKNPKSCLLPNTYISTV